MFSHIVPVIIMFCVTIAVFLGLAAVGKKILDKDWKRQNAISRARSSGFYLTPDVVDSEKVKCG